MSAEVCAVPPLLVKPILQKNLQFSTSWNLDWTAVAKVRDNGNISTDQHGILFTDTEFCLSELTGLQDYWMTKNLATNGNNVWMVGWQTPSRGGGTFLKVGRHGPPIPSPSFPSSPLPFPSPSISSPSPLLLSLSHPSLPSPPLRSRPPFLRLRDLGEPGRQTHFHAFWAKIEASGGINCNDFLRNNLSNFLHFKQ